MKVGDLVEVVVPIPTLFESPDGDLTCVISMGDLVMLLKYKPNRWYKTSWVVVHRDQISIIPARYLRSYVESRGLSDEQWEA
jgi:hypothetical protein